MKISRPNKKYKSDEIKEILINAVNTTTSHGLPNIFRAKYAYLKFIWFIFLFTSYALCSYLVIQTINTYLEYEVVSKTTIRNQIPAEFPTITICNRNPFVTKESLVFLSNLQNKADNRQNYSQKLFHLYYFFNSFALNDTEKQTFGLDMAQFIYECSFNDLDCDYENDFVWVYYVNYGNCFRFNSGKNSNGTKKEIKSIYRVGKSNGLSLKIYVGEAMFDGEIGPGAVFFIHNSTINPNTNEGYDLSTGAETNIAIGKILVNKHEKPYSDCVLDIRNYNSYLSNSTLNTGFEYRQFDCLNLCFQNYLIKNNDCYDPSFDRLNGSKVCVELEDIKNESIVYRRFLSYDLKSFCATQCPLECSSAQYLTTLSLGFFPSKKNLDLFRAKFPEFKSANASEIKERVLAVNFYYETLSYTRFDELAKTDFVELLSCIGGTLGLFIGISVLSFVEIIEVLLLVFTVFMADLKFHFTPKIVLPKQ